MPMRHIPGALGLTAAAGLFAATAFAQSQPAIGAQDRPRGGDGRPLRRKRPGERGRRGARGRRQRNPGERSSVNAVLKPVDSQHGKPGDPVTARTTQAARTEGGTSIPKGSRLIGHVSETHAAAEGQTGSSIGIVFDKAVTWDGHVSAANRAGDAGTLMGASGGAGASRGGGVLGRTSGAVGATVESGLSTASSAAGSLTGGASGTLQGGLGAMGGLDAAGLLTTRGTGVFGLRGLSLSGGAADATTGSVMTSSGKSVPLEQGTRFLLSSRAAASAQGGTPPSGTAKPPNSTGASGNAR